MAGHPPPLSDEGPRLLEQVGRALSDVEGYESAVRVAARCALPGLADLAVLLIRPDGREELVEVAHVDSRREEPIRAALSPALDAFQRVADQDLRAGRSFRWLPSVTSASARFLTRTEPHVLEILRGLGVRSLIVVPLRTGGRLLGSMAFARTETAQPYHAADLAVAQVIARMAAVAIEKSELRQGIREEHGRRATLEDALQKWIRVFDLAGWGAAIVNGADFRIEAVNPAFARIHGHPEADGLIGRLFTDLLPPDRVNESERWPLLDGNPEPFESVHLRSDGSTVPVLTDVTALETGPTSTSYVVTVQDISELKRAEERLRGAQRMEAVGRLAGGVAHEVNNMMTIILGFSDLLAAAPNLPKDRHRDVDEIRKAAIRTARTTQQLLAFSRQQILQPVDLLLEEVVEEMASVLRHLLPANFRVETRLSPVPSTVHADRAQLDQVLINLAFNARDAMPLGGTLRLETGSQYFEAADGRGLIGIPVSPGQYACLKVVDTGHGMDAATVSQVFEPFFTTKPVGTGTGLGLATVYGIVKQSGGFIWVESTVGSGTTFTLCFPQVARAAPAPPPQEPVVIPDQPRSNSMVLVVEDEEGVRELARRILEEEGYRVVDVKNGANAIAALNRLGSEIDLVLSDVIVPDMASVELEGRIRDRRPAVPILYMSGYSQDEVVDRGLVLAERPFIQKPFTAAELADIVARELNAAIARGGPVTT